MKKQTYSMESRTTVVPIINVSLVVVLTLMMISPFLAQEDPDVDLPEARSAEVDETDNVEITFTLDRRILVEGTDLAREDLGPYLGALFAGGAGGVALLKADRGLPYGEVEELIAEIEAANAPRIALATRDADDGEAGQ